MDEKQINTIRACIKNAEDLIKGARAVFSEQLPNIAFHLGIAAMEEIGKACLLRSLLYKTVQESWVQKRFDDHSEKLFSAFLMPHFLKGSITENEVKDAKELANSLHLKRKDAFYVNTTGDDFLLQIPNPEAERIIQMAESRLEVNRAFCQATISEENLKDLDWFISIINDEEKKGLVFSHESISMRNQLNNDVKSWVKWLQQDFANREKILQEFLNQELIRKKPDDEEAYDPKWEFKIRLQAISHSVKQKDLNWWNNHSNWIKLTSIAEGKNKNKEIIVAFSLPKAVHIQSLWNIGYWQTNLFVLALNISSRGLFWWYSLNSQDIFYEEILDVDNKQRCKIKPNNPTLNMDWGQKSLEQRDLGYIGICLSFLPEPDANQEAQQPFAEYLRGIGFLAKTDIHLNLIPNACDLFFRSLKSGMKFYGDWDGNISFAEAFKDFFKEVIQQDEHIDELIKLSDRFEKGEKADFSDLTFDIAMQVKVLCDVYFLRVFQKFAECHLERNI